MHMSSANISRISLTFFSLEIGLYVSFSLLINQNCLREFLVTLPMKRKFCMCEAPRNIFCLFLMIVTHQVLFWSLCSGASGYMFLWSVPLSCATQSNCLNNGCCTVLVVLP